MEADELLMIAAGFVLSVIALDQEKQHITLNSHDRLHYLSLNLGTVRTSDIWHMENYHADIAYLAERVSTLPIQSGAIEAESDRR